MTRFLGRFMITLSAVLMLASCANTIRGFGKDASNTAHATEHAAKDIAN